MLLSAKYNEKVILYNLMQNHASTPAQQLNKYFILSLFKLLHWNKGTYIGVIYIT